MCDHHRSLTGCTDLLVCGGLDEHVPPVQVPMLEAGSLLCHGQGMGNLPPGSQGLGGGGQI